MSGSGPPLRKMDVEEDDDVPETRPSAAEAAEISASTLPSSAAAAAEDSMGPPTVHRPSESKAEAAPGTGERSVGVLEAAAAGVETDAREYVSRDELAKNEEDAGDLVFKVISNDGVEQHLIWLVGAKNIFSQQLPKMPREYVARLVFDRRHRTLLSLKHGRVVGGICFRPFFKQKFAEIAFLAITSSEQVKGYGTRLMNHLKEAVKTAGIDHFLTYADNYAIGYFQKQGFTQKISLERQRWHGYIKDYDGGTLMQCRLSTKVNYLDVPGMLKEQKRLLMARIHVLSRGGASLVMDESGRMRTAGGETLSSSRDSGGRGVGAGEEDEASRARGALRRVMVELTETLLKHTDAWPFTEPVDTDVVLDYLTVVKEPIDLKRILQKVREGAYESLDAYAADLQLMLDNCRRYNGKDTEYFGCADKLEKFIAARLASIRTMDPSILNPGASKKKP